MPLALLQYLLRWDGPEQDERYLDMFLCTKTVLRQWEVARVQKQLIHKRSTTEAQAPPSDALPGWTEIREPMRTWVF